MARSMPRFLFSNPQDTKSKGPFIIHTVSPKAAIRVHYRNEEYSSYKAGLRVTGRFFEERDYPYALEFLEVLESEGSAMTPSALATQIFKWLRNYLAIHPWHPIKKLLLDMGFHFIPFNDTRSGISRPLHVEHYGRYVYWHGDTRLILNITEEGWELKDERPQIEKTYQKGFDLNGEVITQLLIQFGNNTVAKNR